ncbi:MAG: hypothetical protein AAFQ65_15425 [Myxococcota bacterium]
MDLIDRQLGSEYGAVDHHPSRAAQRQAYRFDLLAFVVDDEEKETGEPTGFANSGDPSGLRPAPLRSRASASGMPTV